MSRRLACRLFAAITIASALTIGADGAQSTAVPLCPGLTIVTAISQGEGDYESIKTIESVTDDGVRLKYSSERMVSDIFSNEPPKLERTHVVRSVRRTDLTSSTLYLFHFSPDLPETIPDTTALGTSAAVLKALKEQGEVEIGIFNAFGLNKPGIDRNVRPHIWDFQMIAKVTRASASPVMVPVTVNDTRVELPAIHAKGDFFSDKSEFFFLDDENNPLTLKFRIGIDARKDQASATLAATGKRISSDRDTLEVVKISYRCAPPPPASGGGGGAGALPGGGAGGTTGPGGSALEAALEKNRRADVYDIFFSFNSADLREESEPTLKEIAGLLKKHADWKLSIEGHTDSVASDSFNLDLSRRRAAAVKDALVKRYSIETTRLVTAGHGESRPKDTNDTLEGRARNRRVELVRSGG